MKKFAVIDFEDGMDIVPTGWLSKDEKECRWPKLIKSCSQFYKAVRNSDQPKNDWSFITVFKVLAESGKSGLNILSISMYIYFCRLSYVQ